LDWALQLIAVSLSPKFLQSLMMNAVMTQAIAFLHQNLIAHLVNISMFLLVVISLRELVLPQDISHENFLMNFWGVTPPSRDLGRKPPELRGHFPVKYALIDFGHSIQFPPDSDRKSCQGTWAVPREQRAPEATTGNPFDPFAADIYQVSRTIYGWCRVKCKLVVQICSI
jgi:serine/threonine protein kinase